MRWCPLTRKMGNRAKNKSGRRVPSQVVLLLQFLCFQQKEFWNVLSVPMHLHWRYTHLKNISFTHIQQYRSTHPRPRIFDLLTFLHIGRNSIWRLSTFCCPFVMSSSRIPPSIQKWNVRFSRSQKRSRMAAKVQDIILVVECNALFHHCWITFYAYRKWCLIRVPIKPNTFFGLPLITFKKFVYCEDKEVS